MTETLDPPNLKYLPSDPYRKKKKVADPYSRLWSAKKKKKENIKVDGWHSDTS